MSPSIHQSLVDPGLVALYYQITKDFFWWAWYGFGNHVTFDRAWCFCFYQITKMESVIDKHCHLFTIFSNWIQLCDLLDTCMKVWTIRKLYFDSALLLNLVLCSLIILLFLLTLVNKHYNYFFDCYSVCFLVCAMKKKMKII